VLGLPPAFVLSQDQTLKLKRHLCRVLDERTSAHIIPIAQDIFSIQRASVAETTKAAKQ